MREPGNCWQHGCYLPAEARGLLFYGEEYLMEFLQAVDAEYCEQHAKEWIISGYFKITELL